MDKAMTDADTQKKYVPNHVMEPGPLSDRKLTGTWKDYVSVTKMGIIMSNLLTTLTGMFLAAALYSQHSLPLSTIILTIVGTTCILASGTCLNNYIDRDIDQKMARTQKRALVEGRLHPKNVLIMGLLLAAVGTVLLLFVNGLTTIVALAGLFSYVVVYTMWFKRTHYINTVVGSIAGAIPPVIGWTAVTQSLEVGAWILFLIMFIWQPPHFFALAMRRVEDYRAAGIPMLPVVKGFKATKKQMIFFVIALLPASLLLYFLTDIGQGYLWLALVLGVGWIALAGSGLFVKDDIQWAIRNFLYSLIYLTIMSVGIILISILM